MSRKITLQVPVEMKVRDRDVKVLALLDSRTTRTGSEVVVSLRTLASELETSVDTARRALSSCIDEGYLNVYQNRLENGCQIENSYALTPRGAAVLGAARDAGIVG